MDKIKRAILVSIPMSICNFRCHYCYLSQREECYQNVQPEMKYSPKHVAQALTPERLGGLAYINLCADGETLLTKHIEDYIYELAKEGHYVEIVTNNTITSVLERILSWNKDLLAHITFKCSFHYIELKKKQLLATFASNVNNIWEAGASANIEITPSDELVPLIEEVKEFSVREFGALPHLSIARNDATSEIDYLTEMSMEEYNRIWSQFHSEFWEFKQTIFKQKRNEFCYAGSWMLYIDLSTGFATQCYHSKYRQNIFEDIERPINFLPIGKCLEPHCYNGHMLLTLGCIPNITQVKYGDIRDRVKLDGTHWLQPELKSFLNTTLYENNIEYTASQKVMNSWNIFLSKVKKHIKV